MVSGRYCRCGCGQELRGISTQEYANRAHQLRGNAETLRAELTEARGELKGANAELAQLRRAVERFSTIRAADMKVPAWMRPKRQREKHTATPVLMLSDLHLDEVVDRYQMDGINEYNREIAEKRYERIIDGAVSLLKQYTSGVHYDGMVVPVLGDIISGDIHEELSRTNAAPTPVTITHWVPILASGLVHLADEIGPVYVPMVDGNHDRTYHKTPHKQRAESSYAWIVYNWLADTLRHDPRITFGISTSPEQLVDIYGTTFLLHHGDGFRSQGGIGGLYPSLLKWLLRRHQLYSKTKKDFDYCLMGHWHQDLWGQDFVTNASMVGYNEYARDGGFNYSIAAQQLFIVSPERGIAQRLTVHAE